MGRRKKMKHLSLPATLYTKDVQLTKDNGGSFFFFLIENNN